MLPPGVLGNLRVIDADGAPAIDLRQLSWVTPAHMVGVAALAHRHKAAGGPFTVLGPCDDRVRGYLARMRLGQVLARIDVAHRIPVHALERDRSQDLLEVRAITSEQSARWLAALVRRNVAPLDEQMADALFDSLAEMGDNVADHARATGFMAAQKFPSRHELHIAVADGGVGLLHWLRPSLGASDDLQALSLALAGRSRYTDEADRGGGISRALRLIAAMSGTATLCSGAAWARERAGRLDRETCLHPFTGTLFEARIPLKAAKRSR